MERKFCGKCGKPIAECVCDRDSYSVRRPTTGFGARKSTYEDSSRSGSFYIKHLDDLALCQGEEVVRQYHIGEFAELLSSVGKGTAQMIITNKRVICKQDSQLLGTSSTSIDEIELNNVCGVKNYCAQGFTIWRLVVGVVALIIALFAFITIEDAILPQIKLIVGIVALVITAIMGFTCRKPSYMFSIYSSATSTAMNMGVNLRGKVQNSNGNGIVFQYKPTTDARLMMREMGACIMDLKHKGDYAVEGWKR